MNQKGPIPFTEWRKAKVDRAEDAADTFGHDLIMHCRAEAVKKASAAALPASRAEFDAIIEEVVDQALHNVTDLLEGFWRTASGPNHTVEYALSVRVKDAEGAVVDSIEISPCLIDLPIGYWKWKDGEFQ